MSSILTNMTPAMYQALVDARDPSLDSFAPLSEATGAALAAMLSTTSTTSTTSAASPPRRHRRARRKRRSAATAAPSAKRPHLNAPQGSCYGPMYDFMNESPVFSPDDEGRDARLSTPEIARQLHDLETVGGGAPAKMPSLVDEISDTNVASGTQHALTITTISVSSEAGNNVVRV